MTDPWVRSGCPTRKRAISVTKSLLNDHPRPYLIGFSNLHIHLPNLRQALTSFTPGGDAILVHFISSNGDIATTGCLAPSGLRLTASSLT